MHKFSIAIITISILLSLSTSQLIPCPTNTKLTNFLQLSKNLLISSSSSADSVSESFVSPYSAANFDTKPLAVISIRDYNCQSFTDIQFKTLVQVSQVVLGIKFEANKMKWASVGVVVWVTSRPDLYVGSLTAQNIQPGSKLAVTANTTKPMPFFSNSQTLTLNMINSLTATSPSSNYLVTCTSTGKTESTYTLQISPSSDTTVTYIKIDYIIYNLNKTQFASDGGFFSSALSADTPIHIKLQNNFVPVLYWIVGIQSINLKQKSLIIGVDIDKDYVLSISAGSRIQNAKFAYMAIGQKMTDICSKCDNSTSYAYGDNCVSTCPQSTYPYSSYSNGGKSCLTCSDKLNQIINPDKTGCNCKIGFKRNTLNRCQPSQIPTSVRITRNNASPITSISDTSKSTKLSSVPFGIVQINTNTTTTKTKDNKVNPTPNNTSTTTKITTTTKLTNSRVIDNDILSSSSSNITNNNKVSITRDVTRSVNTIGNNSFIILNNATAATAIRNGSTVGISVNVSPIVTHSVADVSTLSFDDIAPDPICTTNQILNPNTKKCQCDQFSIPLQNTCFKCVTGSFKDNLQCSPCPEACLECRSMDSCDKCEDGHTFHPDTNQCLPSSTVASDMNSNTGGFSSGDSFGSFGSDFSSGAFDGGFSSDSTTSTTVPTNSPPSNNAPPQTATTTPTTTTTTTPAATPTNPTPNNPSTNPQSCPQNSVLLNGKCQCDAFSISWAGNTCFRCITGSYKEGDSCINCMFQCEDCQSATICLKCYDGYSFNKQTNSCQEIPIPVIPEPTPTPTSTNTTITSTTSTSSPTATNPNPTPSPAPKCRQNFVLVNGICVCDSRSVQFDTECIVCPGPTYKDDTNKLCLPCEDSLPNCLTCQNAKKCLTCAGSFQVDATGVCACLPPFHILESTCRQCPPGLVYDDTQKNCIEPPIIINPNFPTPATVIQNTTSTNTITTTTTTSTSNNTDTSNSNQIAIPQNPTTTNPTNSQKCKENQILVNDQCICDSRSVQFNDQCIACPEPTYPNKEQKSCLPCFFIHEQCQTCQSATKCLSCRNNYQLDSKVVCACLPPFHLIDNACNQCPSGFIFDDNQKTCINPGLTPVITNNSSSGPLICKQNQVVQNNACVCDQKSIQFLGECITCPQQTFKDTTTSSCTPCNTIDPGCNTCQNSSKCLTCLQNLKLNTNGKCECLPPFHILDSGCIQCPPSFIFDDVQKTCINPALTPTVTNGTSTGNVTLVVPTCKINQILVNNQCVCDNFSIEFNNECIVCPDSTFKNQQLNICIPCTEIDPECNLCHNDTTCLTCYNNLQVDKTGKCACLPPFYPLESGCLKCPDGFTFQPNQKTCLDPKIPINTNNTTNNVNNTVIVVPPKTCSQNQILSSNTCICDEKSVNISGKCQPCNQGTFKSGQICSPCLNNCLTCTSFSDCSKCADNYRFNGLDRVCELICGVNQFLVNNLCACDQQSGRNAQGICQKCKEGTVKVDEKCMNCPTSCLQCTTTTSCSKCIEGFALNLATSFCCRINQRYNPSNQKCQCNTGFKNISGICGMCGEGLIYVPASQKCIIPPPKPTPNNANSTNPSTLNPTSNATEIPVVPNITTNLNCGTNQIISNGICVCDNKSFKNTAGICQACPPAHFINQIICLPCIPNCQNCSNAQSCDTCHANYTGKACETCAPGYFMTGGPFSILHCQKDECGNGMSSSDQQCDDANKVSGDGCSSKCLIENGYVCGSGHCMQLITKTPQSINSAGIFIEYRYPVTDAANNAHLVGLKVVNGTQPSNIKIIRPANNIGLVKVFIDYCGLLPQENIVVQLQSSSSSATGNVKYVSEYNLIQRIVIPRSTVTKALKEKQQVLK